MQNLSIPGLLPEDHPKRDQYGQFFTPTWAAELLIEDSFPSLNEHDTVLEPTCGPGSFLGCIPKCVPAFGVEIDPDLARRARERTGRTVLIGDIRTIQLPQHPTVIIGNLPFIASLVDRFLARAHTWLPEGGRMGLILPAYLLSIPERVLRISEQWSLHQRMIPRTLFPRIRLPLTWTLFTKEGQKRLFGFLLYPETQAERSLPPRHRKHLRHGTGPVWRNVVLNALRTLGGEASLKDIYQEVEGARPTQNRWWREKIRQVLQTHCLRVAPGRYRLQP